MRAPTQRFYLAIVYLLRYYVAITYHAMLFWTKTLAKILSWEVSDGGVHGRHPFESEGYFLILMRESEVKRNIRGEVTKSW